MVVIIWQLYLQLPVHSVPITIKVVSSTPAHGDVYSIQHYVTDLWFSPDTPVSTTNNTNQHNLTEILLKVPNNTIKPPIPLHLLQIDVILK